LITKERQELIQKAICDSSSPITGGELAFQIGVIHQVVVKDIAVLRAAGTPILATAS